MSKFQSTSFKKEDEENAKAEIERLKKEREELNQKIVTIAKYPNINFRHNNICSMIDTKTKNFMTDTSGAMNCCDCGATPNQVRDDKTEIFEKVNPEAMKMGASCLHYAPRVLENILKMASAMSFKKARAYGKNQQIRDKKFEEICDKLADHHGSPSWRVLPKCRLAASTGNLAREAFSDLPFLSEVTGISIEFLEGVKNI